MARSWCLPPRSGMSYIWWSSVFSILGSGTTSYPAAKVRNLRVNHESSSCLQFPSVLQFPWDHTDPNHTQQVLFALVSKYSLAVHLHCHHTNPSHLYLFTELMKMSCSIFPFILDSIQSFPHTNARFIV